MDPGYVCGIIQDGVGYVNGEPRIRLQLEAYLGAPESYDSVLIEGSPRIYSKIEGGVHGDIATASMTVNSIPAVLTAAPGLRTMRDMRLPSFFNGYVVSGFSRTACTALRRTSSPPLALRNRSTSSRSIVRSIRPRLASLSSANRTCECRRCRAGPAFRPPR